MKKLNEILGTRLPFIQGGMANIATGEFAAACSNAGVLGMIATGGWDGDRLRKEIRRAKELTDKPFGVNIMLMHPQVEQLAAIAAEFAKNGVSINGVNQDLKPTMTDPGYDGEIQQLRVVTHLTDEETLRNTVKAVQALDFVTGDPSILRVLD